MCHLNEYNTSLVVSKKCSYIEASAGTGKTYSICEMVKELVKTGTPIDKILIVTYTEKATQELRIRIRKVLEKAAETEKNNDFVRRFQEARRCINDASIYTIHGFCKSVLSEYAFEAGVKFSYDLNTDNNIIWDITQQKLRDEWRDPKIFSIVTKKDYLGNSEVCSIVSKYMPGECDFYIKAPKLFDVEITDEICSIITNAEKLDDIFADSVDCPALDPLKRLYKSHFAILEANSHEKYNSRTSVSKLIEKLSASLVEMKTWDGLTIGCQGALRDSIEFFKELIGQLSKYGTPQPVIPKIVKSYNEYKDSNIVKAIVEEVYQAWQTYRTDHSYITYDDMISLVRDAVMNENCQLCSVLRERFKAALIDEFQDTNDKQWDIFRKVFFEGDGNKIIVVGDPKQSIFSFQNADLNVYYKAVRCFGEQNGYVLNTNYRSTPAMIKACNELFGFEGQDPIIDDRAFTHSLVPNNRTLSASLWNEEQNAFGQIAPVQISPSCKEQDFADFAITKIQSYMKRGTDGKTALQIVRHTDNGDVLRDVEFRDFAILVRKRSEIDDSNIEYKLKEAGIPSVQYKDQKLFSGRECAEWLALLKLIAMPNLSSEKRGALSEALLSDFFADYYRIGEDKKTIVDADSPSFDLAHCSIQTSVNRWRYFAQNNSWPELMNSIYELSGIEHRLKLSGNLKSYAKIVQIGDYILERLVQKNSSLSEVIKHLSALAKKNADVEEEGDNLVGIASDADSVQIMTIYAAKGLEFPVVICLGGYKGHWKEPSPHIYHPTADELNSIKLDNPSACDSMRILGLTSEDRKRKQEEDEREWKRLFYVAYTRASSVLVLYNAQNNNSKLLDQFISHQSHSDLFEFSEMEFNNEKTKDGPDVLANVENSTEEDEAVEEVEEAAADVAEAVEEVESVDEEQVQIDISKQTEEFNNRRCALRNADYTLMQHSYSSLAKKLPRSEVSDDDNDNVETSDEPVEAFEFEKSSEQTKKTAETLDAKAIQITEGLTYNSDLVNDYPAYRSSAFVGSAVHEIFEHCDFKTSVEDPTLDSLIRSAFDKYGFETSTKEMWVADTRQIVWNALNACLPNVRAGHTQPVGEAFTLSELSPKNHRAEVEFLMNPDSKGLKNLLNGSIDVVFEREGVFSIADWKTDRLDNLADYADPALLADKVAKHYSVQRVLYAYCLIQWLRQFYQDESPEEIFNNHFGGVYYIFVRGCKAGTSNGIYAQTWDTYKTLEGNYREVKKLMNSKKGA